VALRYRSFFSLVYKHSAQHHEDSCRARHGAAQQVHVRRAQPGICVLSRPDGISRFNTRWFQIPNLIYQSVRQQCKHLIQREIFGLLWVNSLAVAFFIFYFPQASRQSLLSIISAKFLYRVHAWLNIHYVKLSTFFVYKSILDLAGRLPEATLEGFLWQKKESLGPP